jgi:predicted nuclease of predicted toxin-antitoxin system
MKSLVDQNLPPRLAAVLSGCFPGSKHVIHLQLDRSRDRVLWRYAIEHGFSLLTQDDDFQQMSMLQGAPPKVVYLANAQGDAVGLAAFVERNLDVLENFVHEEEGSLLILERA